jgi:eukaryotic-like serine/threonine-protein kinase
VLEPGQIFANRYRVNRQIAEGGMGAIFEAVHTATERKVALKLLFPHIMSIASARQKFELEAKISARVNSQYIVEVLDAGFDEGTKSPFLVMELLNGQTVHDHIEQRGPLSPDEALPLLEQVADALDAAHGYREGDTPKPIIHRDLKPENLFMAREHGAFMVKILDFGIAKVLGETSNLSQEVRGTPLYMAVEQITAGVLSPQTDVWALGLIAYYMLTGTAYWKAANNESANLQTLFAEILTLPIDPPSMRVRELNCNVALPPAFDAWLLRCIDRAPTRRFASAGLAVEELARAFRRTPRAGARSAAQAFAATEAISPAAADAALTAPKPARKPKSATAASLPGMASEHRSLAAGVPTAPRTPWIGAAAGSAAVVLGTLLWLVVGRQGSSEAPSAAAAAPAAALPAPAAVALPAPAPAAIAVAAAAPTAPAPVAAAAPPAVTDPPPAVAPAVSVTPSIAAATSAAGASDAAAPAKLTKKVSASTTSAARVPRRATAPAPATTSTRRRASASDAYRMR